jgi:transcriptional antiterminator NusG
MFAKQVEPDLESAAEDADVLELASPGAEGSTAKVAETGAETLEIQPEETTEEIEVAETQAGEAAEETEASETQAEETTEEIEVAETQAGEPAEETEASETQAGEAAEETEIIEIQAEETAQGPEADTTGPEPQDDRAWYVIHCYSGYENKVKHNLEQRIETMQMQNQIFQVVVPTEDEMEVRDGKRRVVERRVFPGYILVQLILTDDSWYVVRNTPGVTGFVGMGNEPAPLRPEEVQAIMRRMEAAAPKIKVTFKPGQKVRIIDGPFNEFIGVVDEIDMERAKVRVLVSFFGRETPVELDFLQVEKT